MPNLVGIGLSQVPTNSMLGGLAYQDPEHASIKDLDLKNLSQINSEISDTAVDVFVYDTRKDSDGGAWRKRTQHTSWYNETLGTATRGTRREFPAVAVIVITANEIIIYDGDDPDLPMWMVFNSDSDSNLTYGMSSRDFTGVSAVNGWIFFSKQSTTGLTALIYGQLNFIFDGAEHIFAASASSLHYNVYTGGIGERNGAKGYAGIDNSLELVNADTDAWDVASTVLPNAPIDERTGLPTPTVAVATSSGVSIIKDDGSVIDYTHQNAPYDVTSFVEFLGDDRVAYAWDSDTTPRRLYITPVRSTDTATVDPSSYPRNVVDTVGYGRPSDSKSVGNYHGHLLGNDQSVAAGMNGSMLAVGDGSDGLNLIDVQAAGDDTFNSLLAFVTTSYNTGWQYGNIKGAFLSDTDTTDAVGTELHPNGNSNFSSTDVSYISNSASGTATVTSGQLVLSGGTSNYSDHIITVSNLEVGAQYIITIDYVAKSAGAGSIGFYVNGAYLPEINDNSGYIARSTGSYSFYFTTAFSSRTIDLVTGGNTSHTHTFDNWSIKKVEEDRSVNDNGLQVFGTITKSAVATGADLVAYGPFSHTNHLKQPYNSDLQWDGNAVWSITFWVYFTQNQAYDTVLSRQQSDGSGNRWSIQTGNQNTITFKAQGSSRVQVPGDSVHSKWRHICFTQEGGLYRAYRDGVEVGTYVGSDNFNNTSAELYIGREAGVEANHSKLALVRISNSAPSAEQIKKMYEDEKHLFQENAKATLYGSSDAVTALGYDEDTELLHVGTSAGRSDFQGLRRINNTTTAVTTAISASDELIAEQ